MLTSSCVYLVVWRRYSMYQRARQQNMWEFVQRFTLVLLIVHLNRDRSGTLHIVLCVWYYSRMLQNQTVPASSEFALNVLLVDKNYVNITTIRHFVICKPTMRSFCTQHLS
ncbi:hypothetical protein Naga_100023g34 [Nannochloropsis gaditana]|uniref:Uncharacterized protein n=1 Tax=Nannochloropsis gaditana TaxID=72520 RepID=W7TQH4_9STRA|nr:hypothetical protein Naga_100023g34 [Nannochloropsis gaditana]